MIFLEPKIKYNFQLNVLFLFLSFSINHGALKRHKQTTSYRAHAQVCIPRFMSFGMNSLHPNLLPSQIKKYPSDVQCVYQFIASLFISLLSDNMGLISLSSGLIHTGRDAVDMLEAESKGETEVLKVINERLVNQSVEAGSFTTIWINLSN